MTDQRAPRDTSHVSAAATGGVSVPPAAAIEPSTAAERPPGRKSSRPPSGRRVVRRSEPLAGAAATDPSSEIGRSAPASTGDTSLLEHPQPGVRELVLGALSASDKRLLLEGGTPRHELSGSSGPLRPEVTLRLREILVCQYTPAAWRSHLAWHSYSDQHGGFGGANLANEPLMAASPPTPRSEHRKVRLTWGQARKWVREEAADQASATKAPGDTSRAAAGGHQATRRRAGADATRPRPRRPAAARPVRLPASAPRAGRP